METIRIHTPHDGWLEVTPHIVCGIWAAHPSHLGDGEFATRGHHTLTHLPSGMKALMIYRKDWAVSVCRFMDVAIPEGGDKDGEEPSRERLDAMRDALFRWGDATEGVNVRRSIYGTLEADHAFERATP